MTKKYFSFLLLLSFAICFVSCNDDEDSVQDRIVGTWQLQSMQEDGQAVSIIGQDDLVQFQSNSIFLRYNSSATSAVKRGGWSYTGGMLNISLDLPAAYYVLNLNANELKIKRLDFATTGLVKTTEFVYNKVSDDLIP
ncbi:MAG: lipocalin family protein [Dysgonomonas sp.]